MSATASSSRVRGTHSVVPTALRESMDEALERLSARVFILRYLDTVPEPARSPDHAAFYRQLAHERDSLSALVSRVLDAWRNGRMPLSAATHLLRSAVALVK